MDFQEQASETRSPGKHAKKNFQKREKARRARSTIIPSEPAPQILTLPEGTQHAKQKSGGSRKIGSKMHFSKPAKQSDFALKGKEKQEHEKQVHNFLHFKRGK
jgi:hypothetical protein